MMHRASFEKSAISCDTSPKLKKSTIYHDQSLTFMKIAIDHQNLGNFEDMGIDILKVFYTNRT